MSIESYVGSVQSLLAERNRKTYAAVTLLRRIVLNYAVFDDASAGSPMATPSATWNPEKPNEHVWLSLYGKNRGQIDRAAITDMESRDRWIGTADFEFSDELVLGGRALTAMIIEVSPPNVKGYDGAPLSSVQLDGAIADLQRYEDALIAGRADEL